MMAQVSFGNRAPKVFPLEVEKDSNEQEKGQNAASQQGLPGFAGVGALGRELALQDILQVSLGFGDLPANLVHQDSALVRLHDRKSGRQALGAAQFDGLVEFRLLI